MAEHDALDGKRKRLQKKTTNTPAPPAHDPKNLTPLTLQRMIGNHATQQVLAQRRAAGGAMPAFIQTKLNVGAADDTYEKEADRVAQQVVNGSSETPVQRAGEEDELAAKRMDIQRVGEEDELAAKRMDIQRVGEEDELAAKRMDIQRANEDEAAPAAMGVFMKRMDIQRAGEEDEMALKRADIQRAGEEDELAMKRADIQRDEGGETEEEELQAKRMDIQRAAEEDELAMKRADIQRVADMSGAFEVGGGLEESIISQRGQGQPMPEDTRSKMESGFGHDFSGVSVHTDSKSDALNRSLNARAFTMGGDVFFRQGEYQPGSKGGQELLAHELTHVVQQGAASPKVNKKENE